MKLSPLLLVLLSSSLRADIPALPRITLDALPAEVRASIGAAYQEALDNPDNADANGRLGTLLQAYEDYALAEPCYQRAAALAPASFDWWYLLGCVQSSEGKRGEAVESLKKALGIRPDYRPGRIKLAEVLLEAGRVPESVDTFRQALAAEPDSPLALYGLGRALLSQRNLPEARHHLERAVALFEAFGSAHYSLGIAYRELKEPEQARRHLLLYQKYQNQWPPGRDEVLDRVSRLKSGAQDHVATGVKLATKRQTAEAIREHLEALRRNPTLVQAHVNLIRLYAESNQPAEAEKHYREAVKLNPNLYESHYNFGVMLLGQQRNREAKEAFQKALDINPYFAEAHNNLAYLLAGEGALEEAERHYRLALHNDPTHRVARYGLARVLVARGQLQQAIGELSRLVEKDDQDTPRYLYALGAAYVRSGNVRKGLEITRKAKEQAAALGQSDLVAVIDRDLQRLSSGK
ncbi:MAG: tetratricopeptide repeat protein [Acidobacteriota bacterium]